MDSNSRHVPERPLPPYSYVPGGAHPHPISDPAGHMANRAHSAPAAIDPADWPASRDFLHGIDLFNHGFYWEAHEAWEGLWHAAGRRGATADFLKGLIKLAAAGVKHRQQMPEGVTSHARRAAELWRGITDERLLGLRLTELITVAEALVRDGWPTPSPILRPGQDDAS